MSTAPERRDQFPSTIEGALLRARAIGESAAEMQALLEPLWKAYLGRAPISYSVAEGIRHLRKALKIASERLPGIILRLENVSGDHLEQTVAFTETKTLMDEFEKTVRWAPAEIARLANGMETAKFLAAEYPFAWEDSLKALEAHPKMLMNEPYWLRRAFALARERGLPPYLMITPDPEVASSKIPSNEQVLKAAEDASNARDLLVETSKQSRSPVYAICNARTGLLFEHAVDSVETQLCLQFRERGVAEGKTGESLIAFVREEYEAFFKEAGKHGDADDTLSMLAAAEVWMKNRRLTSFILTNHDTKIPSSDMHRNVTLTQDTMKVLARSGKGFTVAFLDATYNSNSTPRSFNNFSKHVRALNPMARFSSRGRILTNEINTRGRTNGFDAAKTVKKFLNGKKRRFVFLNGNTNGRHVWYDDFSPTVLGRNEKQFKSGDSRGAFGPDEFVVAHHKGVPGVEYELLSEKFKMALRFHDKDTEGKDWHHRAFRAELLRRGLDLSEDDPEYMRLFREWAPYRVNDDGRVTTLSGYPVPAPSSEGVIQGAELKKLMELAGEVFAELEVERRRSKFRVSVFGTASDEPQFREAVRLAAETAALIAEKSGVSIVTGGEDSGVMKAVHERILKFVGETGKEHIAPIFILPGIGKDNRPPTWGVKGGRFEAVKNGQERLERLVRDSDAYIACTATPGTLAEVHAAMTDPNGVESRKPLVLLDPSDELLKSAMNFLESPDMPETAMAKVRTYVAKNAEEAQQIIEMYAKPYDAFTREDGQFLATVRLMNV